MPDDRCDAASDAGDILLLDLLSRLKASGYRFVTPTPATHGRVLARRDRRIGRTTRDLLGWSLPVARDEVEPAILAALESLDLVERRGAFVRSLLRVSSLDGDLYCHSAYPTTAEDAVFFGPDSYRFTALIRTELDAMRPASGAHIVDVGTGAGVGAVAAARRCPGARITMTDINPRALRYAAINVAAAGVDAAAVLGSDLGGIGDPIDVILANPPYIVDPSGRDYRDGGGMHGAAVALDMARMAIARLAPGGRLILYTGSAIIDGADPFGDELGALAGRTGSQLRYRELDPDVFGEELSGVAYADVERIAVVAAIVERPGRNA
ncbi:MULTISPECIES: methyltransferase [unclassified Sphingomonas]|uniref:methyltransferase n=1 Tax=unclassified Sphingomonas TaxID=196159 RepID=UPI0012E3C27A|nr:MULTISPECIES: methyltransferase [unclassified Sphingomonas]